MILRIERVDYLQTSLDSSGGIKDEAIYEVTALYLGPFVLMLGRRKH